MDERNAIERFIGKRHKELAYMPNVQWPEEDMKKISLWIKKPRNFLIFMGCPGSSKSFTSIAIMRYLYDKRKRFTDYPEMYFYPQNALYSEFKKSYQNKSGDEYIKEKFNTCLVLGIDDFGCTRNNEWQVEIMTNLIEERYKSTLPTIISTNLNFEEIGEFFHPRVKSRLEATENLLIVDWETDWRQKGF